MLTIKTWRDPYDSGFSTTTPKEISLNNGLTVLIGCNGAGKTTLLQNIEEECKSAKIPVKMYNNLYDGGSSAFSRAMGSGEYSLGADLFSSSEGESIKINLGIFSTGIRAFLTDGRYSRKGDRMEALAKALGREDKPATTQQRVLLFDAIDSGLSVDAVAEVRGLFDDILADAKKMGMELYIIASANEYELARNAQCFDVNAGKYVDIPDYEAYRTFVINSRKRKDKRCERAEAWLEKRRAKREAKIAPLQAQIDELEEKKKVCQQYGHEYRSIRDTISDLERKIRDIRRGYYD